jgi:hypothetical protein
MTGRIAALLPDPAPETIDEIEDLIIGLAEEAEAGGDCEALIAELEAKSGSRGWKRESFLELDGWTSTDELAEELALGPAPAVFDLTRAEIMECLDIVAAGRQPRSRFYLGVLGASFPYSDVQDLAFDPQVSMTTGETADEILRRAGSRGPILL